MNKSQRLANITLSNKQIIITKTLLGIGCLSCIFYLSWIKLAMIMQNSTESSLQEVDQNMERDDRPTEPLPKDFKYLLLWTSSRIYPFNLFGKKQTAFTKNNCSVNKCYVTSNRKFFGGYLTKFDAIAFNGRNMKSSDLPSERSRHQQYIFFNMESADNFPVCSTSFDRFFNWTSTYRLDSDIPYPYILIRDKKGEIVGPKRKMRWKEDMAAVDDKIDRVQNKTKAAAWFVSNCKTRSGRQRYVKALKNALNQYGFTVDVYGKCGALKCPRNVESNCKYLLKKDYFFYMSMENSFDEDYVTEKLLTALQNDVVPIVYGGADYTRFLPPGSYIDGRKHRVHELAAIMNRLIHSPEEYSQYFRWKQYYSYHNPSSADYVCAVCEALHDRKMVQRTTVYDNFRYWWNPNIQGRCPLDKLI